MEVDENSENKLETAVDGSEAQVQSTAAEVARILRPGMAPVAKSHRELPAEDDDDRHLPGH